MEEQNSNNTHQAAASLSAGSSGPRRKSGQDKRRFSNSIEFSNNLFFRMSGVNVIEETNISELQEGKEFDATYVLSESTRNYRDVTITISLSGVQVVEKNNEQQSPRKMHFLIQHILQYSYNRAQCRFNFSHLGSDGVLTNYRFISKDFFEINQRLGNCIAHFEKQKHEDEFIAPNADIDLLDNIMENDFKASHEDIHLKLHTAHTHNSTSTTVTLSAVDEFIKDVSVSLETRELLEQLAQGELSSVLTRSRANTANITNSPKVNTTADSEYDKISVKELQESSNSPIINDTSTQITNENQEEPETIVFEEIAMFSPEETLIDEIDGSKEAVDVDFNIPTQLSPNSKAQLYDHGENSKGPSIKPESYDKQISNIEKENVSIDLESNTSDSESFKTVPTAHDTIEKRPLNIGVESGRVEKLASIMEAANIVKKLHTRESTTSSGTPVAASTPELKDFREFKEISEPQLGLVSTTSSLETKETKESSNSSVADSTKRMSFINKTVKGLKDGLKDGLRIKTGPKSIKDNNNTAVKSTPQLQNAASSVESFAQNEKNSPSSKSRPKSRWFGSNGGLTLGRRLEGSSPDQTSPMSPLSKMKMLLPEGEGSNFSISSSRAELETQGQPPVEIKYDADGKERLIKNLKNGKYDITAGTVEALVESLAEESAPDTIYIEVFLLTYRHFMTPENLITLLRERFNQFNGQTQTDRIIRLRVISVVKKWAERHYYDFRFHEVKTILDILINDVSKTECAKFGAQIKSIVEMELEKSKGYEIAAKPPIPDNIKELFLRIDFLYNWTPKRIAQELTLIDLKMFKQIKPDEFCLFLWGEKKDPRIENFNAYIQRFNNIGFWVSTVIVSEHNLKRRMEVMEKFVQILKYCQKYQNYNTLMAIMSGLNTTAVSRLKKTWELFKNSRYMSVYKEIEAKMSYRSNFKAYRELEGQAKLPFIPFFGLYVKDLTFMNDGNQKHLKMLNNNESQAASASRNSSPAPSAYSTIVSGVSTGDLHEENQLHINVDNNPMKTIINFEKCRVITDKIHAIRIYQQSSYKFDEDAAGAETDLSQYFAYPHGPPYVDEEKLLIEMSRECEPSATSRNPNSPEYRPVSILGQSSSSPSSTMPRMSRIIDSTGLVAQAQYSPTSAISSVEEYSSSTASTPRHLPNDLNEQDELPALFDAKTHVSKSPTEFVTSMTSTDYSKSQQEEGNRDSVISNNIPSITAEILGGHEQHQTTA